MMRSEHARRTSVAFIGALVFVYRLVTAGAIEEKIGELKLRKQAIADRLFDNEGNIGKALTEDDIAALLC